MQVLQALCHSEQCNASQACRTGGSGLSVGVLEQRFQSEVALAPGALTSLTRKGKLLVTAFVLLIDGQAVPALFACGEGQTEDLFY